MSETCFPGDFKRKLDKNYLSHSKHSFLQHMFYWPRFKATLLFWLLNGTGLVGFFVDLQYAIGMVLYSMS